MNELKAIENQLIVIFNVCDFIVFHYACEWIWNGYDILHEKMSLDFQVSAAHQKAMWIWGTMQLINVLVKRSSHLHIFINYEELCDVFYV